MLLLVQRSQKYWDQNLWCLTLQTGGNTYINWINYCKCWLSCNWWQTFWLNTLDDYEEYKRYIIMEHLIKVNMEKHQQSSLYIVNYGLHTKIGRQVYAHIYIIISTYIWFKHITIEGLPFATKIRGISGGLVGLVQLMTSVANSFSSGLLRNLCWVRPTAIPLPTGRKSI